MKLPANYEQINNLYSFVTFLLQYLKQFKWVQKMSSGSYKIFYYENVFTNHLYSTYICKEDLALNNLQGLICHKTQLNRIIYI